jgi:hypothetical protein
MCARMRLIAALDFPPGLIAVEFPVVPGAGWT